MSTIRSAAVAGSFYPANAAALQASIAGHLAQAAPDTLPMAPKLLVVPHAGYIYSGDVAAQAYAPLVHWREQIRRVVLLGPSHRVSLRGLAAPSATAFETPLGRVALDQAALARLDRLRQVVWSDLPHAQEHSLEVQLPFLQSVLAEGFTLVPLVVGEASPAEVAEVLEILWGGDETLIVISSDLSHYLPYAEAKACDRATVERILHFETDLDPYECCGAAPLNGALRAAYHHGLAPRLLDLRNSSDTAGGERQRVVGYCAIAFEPPVTGDKPRPDDAELGGVLVGLARNAIAEALGLPTHPVAEHPALRQPGATFVTLHDARGELRGCVGRLEATRMLGDDVRANARAAAFSDTRFSPLTVDEWPGLQFEVSLLSPAVPIAAANEAAALAALKPGVDGVIFDWRGARATLLPQVWAQLPAPRDFMVALKRKAGLPADFWAPDVRLYRYSVRAFGDPA
ncbi:MAG: AmmeMemoRadiSam system protein B [Burkholderiales bacterium]|nr:AmmeMemoRadiSam system protein B [Burkholderiales bacterium]